MKFSIITVVFNGEKCIEKTIHSVLGQAYAEKEYILIDGNSTDSTLSLINKHKNKIEKIISEPDLGIYDAMNKGLKYAKGDYIIFINCDDVFFDQNTLNLIANHIDKGLHPDFVYGDAIEESLSGGNHFYKKARNHKFIWYGMFAHHQAMAYKLSMINKYSFEYNLEYNIGADYSFTAAFLNYATSKLYIDSPLCVYKQGGASALNYTDGLLEQWKIRRDVFHYGWLKCSAIIVVHFMLIQFRKNTPFLYNFLRYNKA